MNVEGTVTSVTERPVGSTLDADYSSSATSITVGDVDEFNADGGTLQIGTEQITYTVDADGNLDLGSGLVASYLEGDPVLVYPLQTERVAYVLEPEGGEELEVRVPHALWDRVPEGVRSSEAEVIEAHYVGGELVMQDVIAKTPVVDATFIDADTLPRASELTDGDAPASSPTVTLTGGPSFVAARWEAIANADLVTYEVHISTLSGFTPDATTLVGEIQGTAVLIDHLADDTPLAFGTTYFVRIVAKDGDGSAAAGTQDSATLVKITTTQIGNDQITTPLINAGAVTANEISVASLAAISVDAGTITAGTFRGTTFETAAADPKVAMDASGLAVTDASANEEVRVDTSGLSILADDSEAPIDSRKASWRRTDDTEAGSFYVSDDGAASARAFARAEGESVTLVDQQGYSDFLQIATEGLAAPPGGFLAFKVAFGNRTGVSFGGSASATEDFSHLLGTITVHALFATPDRSSNASGSRLYANATVLSSTQFRVGARTNNDSIPAGSCSIWWLAIYSPA